ncbi:MAG: hypothetical protein LBI87_11395, partial [Candidatus Accumulibacter sp.]|nr:hypothetical protein [Accumulibacter sp.]
MSLPPPPRKTRVCLALIAAFAAFPAVALATGTTLDGSANGGNPYDADLYGNSGTTATPSDATAASGNVLNLGDGSTGPSFDGSGGSIGINIYGGYATGPSGDANNNTLTVNTGTSFDTYGYHFYGGYVDGTSGNASSNAVTVGAGIVQGTSTRYFDITGGQADGTARDNQVSVAAGNDNTFELVEGGSSIGGAALGNSVTIAGGTGFDLVFGGISAGSGDAGGLTTGDGNTVNITGGSADIMEIYGGYSSGGGAANGNTVTLDANYTGTVSGGIYGGHSSSGGAANGNRVEITGGSVGGNIYGGDASGDATNNTVTLGGNVTLAAATHIFGGISYGTSDYFTGNTLVKTSDVVIAASGTTANNFGAQNFETVKFGYSGDANIGSLDTTVRGGTAGSLVKLEVTNAAHAITFAGV